jgi:signal transduction histidine kinase
MKIKYKLNVIIYSIIFLIAALIIIVVIFINNINWFHEKTLLLENIIEQKALFDSVTYEYFLFQNERALYQWRNQWEEIKLLYEALQKIDNNNIIATLIKFHNDQKVYFEKIIKNNDIDKNDSSTKMMKNMSILNAQSTSSILNNYFKENSIKKWDLILNSYILLILIILPLSLIVIFVVLILNKSISKSLMMLKQGISIIKNGNLKYVINLLEKDEMQDLAENFNNMTKNLLTVMANRNDLENEVKKRKLAENELNQTLLNLERSNKELEQFAYVASHDLQEPLRMVSSYTQLLAKRYKDKLDKDADDFINFAVEGAVRMQGLINSLFEYSRVTTKGAPFTKIECNKLLNDILKYMENIIKENKAEIIFTDLPTIFGDEIQIFRIFQNLIQNAVKFKNDDDIPRIYISAKKENDNYIFSIKDNGIGIDKEYFDMIFVIFKRLHSRDKYQGSGMGLSITKRIIERHGGTIWLESEPGIGTVFYFTIPIIKGEKI